MQHIVIVELQDQRNPAREVTGPGFEKAQRRGVGVTPGVHGQLEMIERIVAGRVGCKTSCRPMFESLINRQDHQFTGSCQFSMTEQAGQIGSRTCVVASVPAQDFSDAIVHSQPLVFVTRESLFAKGVNPEPLFINRKRLFTFNE